jgi:hypothetical protein
MIKWFRLWLTVFFIAAAGGCAASATESPPVQTTATAVVPSSTLTSPVSPAVTTSSRQMATPLSTVTSSPQLPIPTATTLRSEEPTTESVVVMAGDSTVFQLVVGQKFTFQGPRGPEWQIGYDQSLLTLLTPEEVQQQPGDRWEFQANQTTGRTRIWLNSVSPPCEGEFCPPPAGATIQLEAFVEIRNE